MVEVTAMVLAGGQGTRLRGVLPGIPKVLAPVCGRPFLAHLLDQIRVAGIREVVLCTGYRADQVCAAFGSRYEDIALRYSIESRPLGTAGALRLAITRSEAERYLVLNGDSYLHCALDGFDRWHRTRESSFPGSLLLTWAEDTSRFGTVELGPRDAIRSFREKSQVPESGWINTGIYLLRRSLLESIPADRESSIEREMFPRWIARGLGGYATRAPFVDIGTPESFAAAESFMAGVRAVCRSPEISPVSV